MEVGHAVCRWAEEEGRRVVKVVAEVDRHNPASFRVFERTFATPLEAAEWADSIFNQKSASLNSIARAVIRWAMYNEHAIPRGWRGWDA